MKTPLKILKASDNEIVYSLSDKDRLDENFFADLDWPAGIKNLKFFLSVPCQDEFKTVLFFAERFPTKVIYSASKADLPVAISGCSAGIETAQLKSLDELKDVFIETNNKYREDAGKPLTDKEIQERGTVAATLLARSRSLCLQNSAQIISMLVVFKWMDCFGAPVDWIPWVWIKSDISREERSYVHAKFIEWLRGNVSERVQCIVASDNLRSRKFFLKLGFHPECISITREK